MKESDKEKSLSFFRRYYEANVSSLVTFALRFVPTEVAEDIIHDLFLEIWNRPISDKLPSRSYLFMAVRNRCLNYVRKEQVKDNYIESTELDNRILGLDYYDSHDKFLIDKEEIKIIHRQIEQLPEKCRIIFKMAYFEDKKSAEIAEILGISVRTVEHHIYLGLRSLRSKLAKK
jgi:RNA polymerase sigma-70 factor (ECF subfamily)